MRMKTLLAGLLASGCCVSVALAQPPAHGDAAAPAAETGQKPAGGHAGHGGGRRAKMLMLANADGARITYWKPDLTRMELSAEHGHLTLPPTGMDNYHALVVEQDWGPEKDTLIRYEYSFGKPSGHSPAELTAAVKTELEVVPDPIPREHYRYMAADRWSFLVRYQGQPLAGTPVLLATSQGSRLEAVTDAAGRVTFRLPDDFPEVEAGRENNTPAELSVTASHREDGLEFVTVLTAPYHADPAHWQSFPTGVAIAGAGFLVGGLVGFRRRHDNKKRGSA
ncbi:hypothetical protein DFQ59_1169 [Thioalbus denitrificans]|uniref:Nickel transport protein n=2 Tax=Thioalbus denitrificans TaxID=547122 RepID=A0A369BYL6_9GAMM|nr:hypothetical protein DFQ59_1169 [Thioalbus denitrificans]